MDGEGSHPQQQLASNPDDERRSQLRALQKLQEWTFLPIQISEQSQSHGNGHRRGYKRSQPRRTPRSHEKGALLLLQEERTSRRRLRQETSFQPIRKWRKSRQKP